MLIAVADPDRLLQTVLTNPRPQAKMGAPCIHYEQPRRFTIAEAKRAQGFLDRDVLLGSPSSRMRQIGNSVSRHVSYAIGLSIRDAMLEDSVKDVAMAPHTDVDDHDDAGARNPISSPSERSNDSILTSDQGSASRKPFSRIVYALDQGSDPKLDERLCEMALKCDTAPLEA